MKSDYGPLRSPDSANQPWGPTRVPITQFVQFVVGLADAPQNDQLFNPWFATDEHDHDNAHLLRQQNLIAYLRSRQNAQFLFVGEAAGCQGCRFSGIPMTSERMLRGHHNGVRPEDIFLGGGAQDPISSSEHAPNATAARLGYTERTATTVWRVLRTELGIQPFEFVLWNLVPWHPHNEGQPLTNRLPNEAECRAGLRHTEAIINLFPQALVIPVGNTAGATLAAPHPSRRQNAFRAGVERLLGRPR